MKTLYRTLLPAAGLFLTLGSVASADYSTGFTGPLEQSQFASLQGSVQAATILNHRFGQQRGPQIQFLVDPPSPGYQDFTRHVGPIPWSFNDYFPTEFGMATYGRPLDARQFVWDFDLSPPDSFYDGSILYFRGGDRNSSQSAI